MILKKNVVDILFSEAFKNTDKLDAFARFCHAYDHAQETSGRFPTEDQICAIAAMIEPKRAQGYRVTPVYFTDLSMGMHHDLIPAAMESLIESLPTINGIEQIDEVVKHFFVIHPFRDGNGRTAFILRTWLMGNWDYPERLPDYFGKDDVNG